MVALYLMHMTLGRGTYLLTVSALIALVAVTGAAKGGSYGGDDKDFSDLLGMYSAEGGNFTALAPGDTYVFTDIVAHIMFNTTTGNTEIWLESTGSSIYSPHLPLLGESSDIERGAKVQFNVTIFEVPGTGGEWFSFDREDVKVLKEAPEGLTDGNSIKVMGFRIGLDFLPKELQVPFVRSLVVFIGWMGFTFCLWWATIIAIKLADRSKIRLNKTIINILRMPFFTIVLIYGLLLCVALLEPPHTLMRVLYSLYEVSVIVLVSIILVKFSKNVLFVYLAQFAQRTENKADDILIPVLNKVISVVIWVVAVIMVLERLGVDVSVFLAALGIGGLVIAFAAQDTLSNFFSGVVLLIDRPFKEGDWIKLDEKVYQVRDIGLRSTRLLHSYSNQIVTIPNNRISDHLFSNLNVPDLHGRTSIAVGVGYGCDPRKVGQVLVDEVKAHPDVFEDKQHSTIYRFIDYGDSSLRFEVTFWVKDFNEQWRVCSELRERIFYRFAREGIEIPYPQRVVHLKKDPGG
jgi:small-conductance mechanosensitive channel